MAMKTLLIGLVAAILATGCGGRGVGVSLNEISGKTGDVDVTVTLEDKPAPGAMVQLIDASQAPVTQVKADEEGHAIFKDVPTASGYVAVADLEGATGRSTDLIVAGGKTLARIVLAQGQGPLGLVIGTVKLQGDDRPLPGVLVTAGGKKATTDANGQFRLDGVSAGQISVKATLTGYVATAQAVIVKAGTSNAVAITLTAQASGPNAGHTLVTTSTKVVDFDAWRNPTTSYAAKGAVSAVFTPTGTLVADAAADKVQEYGTGGTKGTAYTARPLWQLGIGGISAPGGATRTPQGNVLIADTGHNRIVELNSSNQVVWEYKDRLSGPRWAQRLANGNTLIADTGNNRIIELSKGGQIVWGLGDGSGAVVNHPAMAQRLPNGNTLVCDSGNNRVMEVNAPNQLVWMTGGGARGSEALLNPNSAKRLANGNTLIADTENNRVIEVDTQGTVVWKVSTDAPLFADRL